MERWYNGWDGYCPEGYTFILHVSQRQPAEKRWSSENEASRHHGPGCHYEAQWRQSGKDERAEWLFSGHARCDFPDYKAVWEKGVGGPDSFGYRSQKRLYSGKRGCPSDDEKLWSLYDRASCWIHWGTRWGGCQCVCPHTGKGTGIFSETQRKAWGRRTEMTKLGKYLKPFALSILAIVALLFTQAMCELAMPDYMSSIVDVGIVSGGVEDGVPSVIRESEVKKLVLFLFIHEQNKLDRKSVV